MKLITHIFLISVGWLSVVLALFGIFLPLLPTTPFLLLAAICFAKSSPRFYQWLMTNRWFGEYLNNYRAGRGMQLRHKITALTLMWVSISYSAIMVAEAHWLRGLLVLIAVLVTWHLVRMPTYRLMDQMIQKQPE